MKSFRIYSCFIALSLAVVLAANPAFAASVQELNQQRNALQQQAQNAQRQAQQKQLEANGLQSEIGRVNRNIDEVSAALDNTATDIEQNKKEIDSINLQIADKEKELSTEEDKMKSIVASQYMAGEAGLLTTIVNSKSISEATDKYEQYETIQNELKRSADSVKTLRDDLVERRDELDQKRLELQGLEESQSAEQQDLESQKQWKNKLLNNTQGAISDLQNQAKNAQAQIAAIDQKIRALSGTRNWGTQIVSLNDSRWYYTQTGNYTNLGSSPYTVDQYGCLVTSMAMVATYYGNRITPTDIAQMNGIFSSNGYLLVSSPQGLGVSILPSQAIDWSVVDRELASGRPVIVSIYLPSVGKINEDGSSHFIVIKGKSGGKYLMHDPISGQRGYDLSQVRSMKLVRNN